MSVTPQQLADTPRQLGRYALQVRVGSGATASAWRGLDRETGRPVCLKVLHPRLLGDAPARARLEAEAVATNAVGHPAIVPVIGVHRSHDSMALVFPYVDGTTLSERLARRRELATSVAARIAADIASALAAIHERGVIHRDVKPSNILLGTDGRARLLDFGIASAQGGTDAHSRNRLAIGTLPYMSPEQLAGMPAIPGTDVFALGAVLYEMLSGRRPYDAATPTELAEAHRQPPEDVPQAPRPLLALAWAALARDDRMRPTAGQLVEGLERWLADGSLPAPPARLDAAGSAGGPGPGG